MPSRLAILTAASGSPESDLSPLVQPGLELGLKVDVVGPSPDQRAGIEALGARFVALGADIGRLNPVTGGYATGQLAAVLKQVTPDIVLCAGLPASLTGGAACALAGIDQRIYDLRTLGNLVTRQDLAGRILRRASRFLLTGPLKSRGTRFLVASAGEGAFVGLGQGSREVSIVPRTSEAAEAMRSLYASMLAQDGRA